MSEQRMKILEMLEAGKLTVEEASMLLRAVSGADSEQPVFYRRSSRRKPVSWRARAVRR